MEEIRMPVNAIYSGNYKILIEFDNGELKIADFKHWLDEDLKSFSDVKDEDYFKKFYIDEFGALTWPNGYDVAPDYLYDVSKPAVIQAVS
ncbi:MAG: DUF2442 domain-containing protein [Ignavibacteria bacterium]|nr:DUF2442 domain-containing protein [Ignavibacteria bacterium]